MERIINKLKITYSYLDFGNFFPYEENDDLYYHTESILIDRNKGKVIIDKEKGQIEKSHKEYYHYYDVEELLDNIGKIEPILSKDKKENEDDGEIKIYIEYSDKTKQTFKGYNKRPGLPKNWSHIVETIRGFLEEMDEILLLPESYYYDETPCNDEVRIISVYFGENEDQLYDYICNFSVEEGDIVIVPIGKNNKEVRAIVSKYEIYKKNQIPMPITSLKEALDVEGNIYYDDDKN